MKKHILIAGYYGFRNNGDEAILRVLLADLQRAEEDLSVCVLSGDPEATRRCFGVEAIAHGDVVGIIEQVRQSDALIVGGGGIFQDYWGSQKNTILTSQQAGLPFYSSLPLLGRLLKKPVLLYAVGAGPLFSTEGKELTRLSFDYATVATVRDGASLELLHSLGIPAKKMRVTADPAFALKADTVRAREILNGVSVDPNRPVVGVCLRNWDIGIEQSIWQAETASGLDNFADRTGCSYIFLPFQDLPVSSLTRDPLAADSVFQQMKHHRDCVFIPIQDDPAVTAGILSTCTLIVGMRYHSIVFASSVGVVPVALAYDSKVTHLMHSLGLAETTLRLSDLSGAALLSCLTQVLENRPLYHKQLAGRVAKLKRSATGNFQAIQKLLAGGSTRILPERDVDQFIREFALQQSLSVVEREQATRELVARIQEKDHALHVFTSQLEDKELQIQALDVQLNDIYRSRAWTLMLGLWNARKRMIPPDSRRERVLRSIWWNLHIRPFHPAGRGFQPPFPFNDRYIVEDNSRVTLFKDDPLLFPNYPVIKTLSNNLPDTLQVSLIASVKNEAGNIAKWMDCVQKQTRLPNEIVIVDGGSTDGTDQMLENWSNHCPVPLKVIKAPGTNIARGRNIAIQEARYSIIAVTDFGCEPKPDWLEMLIQPFKLEPETRVSAGFYESIGRTGKVLSGNGLWPGLGKVDPQAFLPSSRSVAFRKEVLDAVGGHPEWLTKTGDDTYLDLELKRLGGKWAFVPEAQVKWIAPEKLGVYLGKMYQWASGDGESGVNSRYYWRYFLNWCTWLAFSCMMLISLAGALVWRSTLTLLCVGLCCLVWLGAIAGLALNEKLPPQRLIQKGMGQGAQVLGFLKGARNRKAVDKRRESGLKGVFFILSGVPLDDSGGGARGAQIAQELLRTGWGVVFLNKFERDETKDLQLRNCHPNLFLSPIDRFRLKEFVGQHSDLLKNKPVLAMIEFPLPDYLPLAKQLRDEYGATVAYDLLDDWNTSLGGKWYTPEVEEQTIHASTHLVATLPGLACRLEKISGRKALILPNAVNARLFDPHRAYPRPNDLPAGQRILIYVGALWGDWFDWDLLEYLADSRPEAQIVLIGDYRGQAPFWKRNVHFLGLKAQKELPAYLAHADASLLPWKVTAITQTTSPLKVYEYLAMRLPVVASSLEPLRDMPGVFTCDSREEYSRLAGSVSRHFLDEGTLAGYIQRHNWTAHLDELLGYLNQKE